MSQQEKNIVCPNTGETMCAGDLHVWDLGDTRFVIPVINVFDADPVKHPLRNPGEQYRTWYSRDGQDPLVVDEIPPKP
jgi:hypothetical protein